MSDPAIHPAAHIHPRAKIGAETRVGPGAVIGEHVQLGPRCEIRAHAILTGHTRLGTDNQVGYGAIIGAEPQDLAFEPGCESRVVIGDRNIFREHVTIHRGTKPGSETRIGSGCFLMAGAHLAHNCQVGDGAILANNALCAGYVEIGQRAFISGNTVIHQFCRVGRLALLRGGGRISKDLPPFMIGDSTNRLMGLNTIGLRRAGFPPETRLAIKRLFNSLFRSGQNLSAAIAQCESAQDQLPEIAEILAFLRGAKKGVLSFKGQRDSAED